MKRKKAERLHRRDTVNLVQNPVQESHARSFRLLSKFNYTTNELVHSRSFWFNLFIASLVFLLIVLES